MRYGLPLALLALLTGGCAEFAATAVTDARDIHAAGRAFVFENHEWRREIRRRCRELTIKQADALEEQGDLEGARDALRRAYPQLLTVSMVKQVMDDPENFSAESSGCD